MRKSKDVCYVVGISKHHRIFKDITILHLRHLYTYNFFSNQGEVREEIQQLHVSNNTYLKIIYPFQESKFIDTSLCSCCLATVDSFMMI